MNSGSCQIPEHGAWTLCMNITPTSIEYQLADARLLAVDGHQHLPVNAPTLRPCLRPLLNAGGISTAATRSTASISPLACMDRLIRLPALHKPCPRHAGKHRSNQSICLRSGLCRSRVDNDCVMLALAEKWQHQGTAAGFLRDQRRLTVSARHL